MCWIIWHYKYKDINKSLMLFKKWVASLKHRWPDNFWIFQNDEILLWHTLLTIQSDSNTWKQPYEYNNIVITFNGEIFNKEYLRAILKGNWINTNTDTDTEIVAKILYLFGIDWFSYFDWFFSIAYYNIDSWDLFIARDAYWIKPLYFTSTINWEFIFSSEIKWILSILDKKVNFNYSTLIKAIYFQLWMDYEDTYFDGIFSLKPWIILNVKTWEKQAFLFRNTISSSIKDELSTIEDYLLRSINKNIDIKYPVACLLSGWIDSTLITKQFAENSKKVISAYTTIYNNCDNPDLLFAEKLLKQQNNIKHIKVTVSEYDYSLQNLSSVTFHMEEIMLDKVYVSMWMNFKKIAEDWYRVVLSGQGSDELWAWYYNTWKIYKLHNESDNLTINQIIDFYSQSSVFRKYLLSNSVQEASNPLIMEHINKNLWYSTEMKADWINLVSDFAQKTILHNLLLQEDKLSMAFGIECRVPFLDSQDIWYISRNTSWHFKVLDWREKYPIRKIAEKLIWKEFSEREKYPFPESPSTYNSYYRKLLADNIDGIGKSKILNYLLNKKIYSETQFTDKEVWWIIAIWQFEETFKPYLNY